MPVTLTLSPRTWASLDAALGFFRMAPAEVAASQRLAEHCRRLHRRLHRLGIRWRYAEAGLTDWGRTLLRLQVQRQQEGSQEITLDLPQSVARSLAKACLIIIEVQSDNDDLLLLDHETEELQAAKEFLSELRRRSVVSLVPERRRRIIRWDEAHQEYLFNPRMLQRVQDHYLRTGASPN
jgi:hypothetical protein